MTGFIVLDTNIYRQLGLRFFEHIDYVNLTNFCYASGFEMSICETVSREFLDYFEKVVLQSKVEKLKSLTDSINAVPFIKNIRLPKLDDKIVTAVAKFSEQINSPHFKIKSKYISVSRLTEFLLENKHIKDSTRDFLIWESLVEFAKNRIEDKVCFITNDQIFKTNASLRKGINKNTLNRIEIYDSITDFLSKNGYKIDFVTLSYLEEHLDYEMIIKDLFRSPSEILSYISSDYYHLKGMIRTLKKEIEYKKVDKFYTYIDPSDNKQKFLAHVILKPLIIYKIPSSYRPDPSKLSEWEIAIAELSSNTYDSQGNPMYNQEVLSLVGGILDLETKTIVSQEVYDCFLDYYRTIHD